jgi:hypothetical protein
MANQDRSRVEVLRRRDYPTSGTGVVLIGDMAIGDGSGNAIAATGTDDAVADTFLGVSLHAKATDKTPTLAIGVDVVAEMDLASGLSVAAVVGDSIEYDSANSNAQTVKVGSTNPIGKVYRATPIGATTIMVHFVGKDVRSPVVPD